MAWSIEHLRSFILEKTSTVKVLEPTELTCLTQSDMFPLTSYVLGGKSIVNPETVHLCSIDCYYVLREEQNT